MPMPPSLELQPHPESGLGNIPWAFKGDFNLSLGQDGVAWSEVMYINWADLQEMVKLLLGYSWRDKTTIPTLGVSQLRRSLPWQHPYFNQLWVKNITDVKGIQLKGTSTSQPEDDDFIVAGGGAGFGVPINLGPWTQFDRAQLTVQFWRPPYQIRSDDSVRDSNGYHQEWLRYVDKHWSVTGQVLSREGSVFKWASGGPDRGLPGAVGQVVTHERVTRTWYEVPEAGIFQEAQDDTPNGQAVNLLYSQTEVVNPITGYIYIAGYPLLGAVNTPIGGGDFTLAGDVTDGSPTVAMASTSGVSVGDTVNGSGIPAGTYVTAVVLNTSITISVNATATAAATTLTFVSDQDSTARMFGCYMGILRYDNAELIPRPLQLPPYLMLIPIFADNEAVSQQQYDVRFHFDIFDPPRMNQSSQRGHNLLPWSANGLWHPVISQNGILGTTAAPFLTIHPYFNPADLFQIL